MVTMRIYTFFTALRFVQNDRVNLFEAFLCHPERSEGSYMVTMRIYNFNALRFIEDNTYVMSQSLRPRNSL